MEENTGEGGTFENLQVALLNVTPEPPEVKAMLDCVSSLESVFVFQFWRLTLGPFETISSHKKVLEKRWGRWTPLPCGFARYKFTRLFYVAFFFGEGI